MSRRSLTRAVTVLALATVLNACATNNGDGPSWKEGTSNTTSVAMESWPETSPRDAGIKPAALRRQARHARQARSSCFAVFRDGQLVGDWNWGFDADRPRQVFSVTKSVTSALVGIALQDGSLALDDPVSKYVPSWRGTDSADVTIRNLLSNDSGRFWSQKTDYVDLVRAPNRTRFAIGLPQQYEPGEVWAYNNAAIQVLDAVLREATGQPVDTFARERLFSPLGMSNSHLVTDQSKAGGAQLFFGLETTCLDLARFGQLYLDGGQIDGTQILPADFVEDSVAVSSTRHNAAYGLLWWINLPGPLRGATDDVGPSGQPLTRRQGQLAPGAPQDLYAALGLGGQVLLVDPGSRTMVVRLSKDLRTANSYGFTDAAEAVTSILR
jgi:CubicO group peptidase (beta-lactamase class C family)